ncbi:MAG: MYG1 family protein, partial [Solirubrobacterales bacterium]
MRVATHPGNFHADDAFAVATLRLAHGDGVEVVRTRDEAVQAAADVRVDVGGRSDPETGDFDHHQKGGAGERPNGIRYASFGLVWRAFGTQVAGSRAAAASIDERLVQGVDANDTGQ